MDNNIIVYTAIFEKYDKLEEPNFSIINDKNIRFICFTDDVSLSSKVWEIFLVSRKFEDATRENRYYKIMFHLFLPSHFISIYIDGNVFLKPYLFENFISEFLVSEYQMALLKHPLRNCMFEEGEVCIRQNKDSLESLNQQLIKYWKDNMPLQYGLWACTVLIRKNSKSVISFCVNWWEELEVGSKRDQISFAYLVWKYNVNWIKTIDLNWKENNLYKLGNHQIMNQNFNSNFFNNRYLPRRLKEPFSWIGHIPFAMWLVDRIKPDCIVELGTHSGNSFFAFCEAIQKFFPSGKVYAVDSWLGDFHSGIYGSDIYNDVYNYNRQFYANIGYIIKKNFNEAVSDFDSNSIDLLHIDGFHTYEAVKNDFYTWLPKLKKDGIILIHDINVFDKGFGVYKFWDEIKGNYKYSYQFLHSFGLGVLCLSDDFNSKNVQFMVEFSSRSSTFELLGSLGESYYNLVECKIQYNKLLAKYEKILTSKSIKIINILKKIKNYF